MADYRSSLKCDVQNFYRIFIMQSYQACLGLVTKCNNMQVCILFCFGFNLKIFSMACIRDSMYIMIHQVKSLVTKASKNLASIMPIMLWCVSSVCLILQKQNSHSYCCVCIETGCIMIKYLTTYNSDYNLYLENYLTKNILFHSYHRKQL